MKNTARMLLLLAACAGFPQARAVEEAALYADEAPEGSAFVRVFNGFPARALEDVDLGGKIVRLLAPLEPSPYVYLPPGEHTVRVEDAARGISMQAGQFYTVLVGAQFPPTVIRDEPFTNRRKALLSLYNVLSKQELDLKTADGSVSIIEDVDFLGNKTREINPVRLSVLALAGDRPLGQSGPVSLQWGKVFSLFACGEDGRPKLVWVENRIDAGL